MCTDVERRWYVCERYIPVVSAVEVLHPRSHIRGFPGYGMSSLELPDQRAREAREL